MDDWKPTLERIGTTALYGLLGVVGTAAVALALLYVTQPVQPAIYRAVYLQVGPSEATETAILTQFVGAGVVAIAVPTLLGDYVSDGLEHGAVLAKGIAAMLALVVAFLAVALAGLAAFLTALLVLTVGFVGVPLVLRYRYGVRSGGVAAFVGGVPVVVFLLLAAGFGLGWGWGYVVTAEEVPESAVDGTAPAAFEDAPEISEDLFAADNCETVEDRRMCRLYLRGYEHETATARWMADHGVRCPYQNAQSSGQPESVVVRHDGSYYRISCSPHGD